MIPKKLSTLITLAILSMGLIGCATPSKETGYSEGIDYIPFEKGAAMGVAPERGAFLSDRFYKFQFEHCNK